MNCFAGKTNWKDFIGTHFENIRKPFVAGIELWPDCNFRCIHCYAESDRVCDKTIMSTVQIERVIDILVAHDCLELFLTGGEALLRDDFFSIYRYAKGKGLLVSVLTNGSLISEEHIKLWKEYPPELISLTMYGASNETYQRVTGCTNGYDLFTRGVDLLQKNSIPFEIKCIGMKQNYDDILLIRQYGRDHGMKNAMLAWDIRPMTDGNKEPINCRVTAEEAFLVEVHDPERKQFWQTLAMQERDFNPMLRQKEGYLYPCGIAHQFVFITCDGYMQGCVKAVRQRYNLLDGDFNTGWNYLESVLVNKKASVAFACTTCKHFKYCGQCSAAFDDENGNPEKPVDFYCQFGNLCSDYMTQLRHQV